MDAKILVAALSETERTELFNEILLTLYPGQTVKFSRLAINDIIRNHSISTRLGKALQSCKEITYVDELTSSRLLTCRNTGEGTLRELNKILQRYRIPNLR